MAEKEKEKTKNNLEEKHAEPPGSPSIMSLSSSSGSSSTLNLSPSSSNILDSTTTTTTTTTATTMPATCALTPCSSGEVASADELSRMLAPYLNKSFYAREWLFVKLYGYMRSCLRHQQQQQTLTSRSASKPSQVQRSACALLVLVGESATGKSHLCCELKWPTYALAASSSSSSPVARSQSASARRPLIRSALSGHIHAVYFFSSTNKRQNRPRNVFIII